MPNQDYCAYCGRVTHRCECHKPASRIRQLLARHPDTPAYHARTMTTPYKRGVPPQIKRRERATLRKHYDAWHADLVAQYGAGCANCGALPDDTTRIVIDHVLSIAKGGLSVPDNLQLLCADCNRIKGKLWYDCRA